MTCVKVFPNPELNSWLLFIHACGYSTSFELRMYGNFQNICVVVLCLEPYTTNTALL
jgi:hypothetical protein